MADKPATLEEFFASTMKGVGTDRIAVRTQGCWNCKNFRPEEAAKLWWDKARREMLERGTAIAVASPQGENHPVVRNIRDMVPKIDTTVTRGEFGCCHVGKGPSGETLGDFIASTYLCGQWSAAEGASVAREGQKADKLPEELFERFTDDGKLS